MSSTLKNQDSNKKSSAKVKVSSKDVISYCVKDLSLQLDNNKNVDENVKENFSAKNKSSSPAKINISIEKDNNSIGSNSKNVLNNKFSKKSNEEKEIKFSILLPKEYRESKNCKIKLSMDMNISIDDDPNQKLEKNSNIQSRKSIANSMSSSNSNKINNNKLQNMISNKNENEKKAKVKKNIIGNQNNNESLKERNSINSLNNSSLNSSLLSSSLLDSSVFNSSLLNSSTVNNSSYNNSISNNTNNNSVISSKTPSKLSNNYSTNSNKRNSINSASNLDSSSYSKTDTTPSDRDAELLKIRKLKYDIDKVIKKENLSGSSKNSISFNSLSKEDSNKSSKISFNTMHQLFSSKESVNSKPPLANNIKKNSIQMNQSSHEPFNENSIKKNSKNDNLDDLLDSNNDIIKNLYLPKDNKRIKSKEELTIQVEEQEVNNNGYGMFSPMDDEEYNYLIDLIDNEYNKDTSINDM